MNVMMVVFVMTIMRIVIIIESKINNTINYLLVIYDSLMCRQHSVPDTAKIQKTPSAA